MEKIFNRRTLLPNLKVVSSPLIILITSVVLLVVVINNFYPKVKSMFSNLDESKRRNTMLEDRIRILREFQVDAKSLTDISAIALPIDNPGTLILSHIKSLSNEYGIDNKKINRMIWIWSRSEGFSWLCL